MLDRLLTLSIPRSATRDMNSTDLDKLLATYAIAEQAKEDFLNQQLTWDEYLELLEMAQVNIDSYREIVEGNLEVVGAM